MIGGPGVEYHVATKAVGRNQLGKAVGHQAPGHARTPSPGSSLQWLGQARGGHLGRRMARR